MAIYGAKINKATLNAKLLKAAEIKGLPAARKKVYDLFYRAKRRMLHDFDIHNVTQEIKAGGTAADISGVTDGYGNLFSYIGFEAGSDPIGHLREALESNTTYKFSVFRNKAWYFDVKGPSKEVIEKASPMPWASELSWVDGIENGMDNLTHYLNKRKKQAASRSGYGLQTEWEINDDLQFKTDPYLSEILENFRDRINNSRINEA